MRLLIVEDLPAVSEALSVLLTLDGFECELASSPQQAIQKLAAGDVGVVIQDMNFAAGETDGASGVELFRRMRALDPALPIVLITAWSSLETAIALVKEGAVDYFQKPWDDARLLAAVRSQMQLRSMQRRVLEQRVDREHQRRMLQAGHQLGDFVVESEKMIRLLAVALQAAPSDLPILIGGESGAGKRRLADLIVANSRRRAQPLVRFDAAATAPERQIEELFGAEPPGGDSAPIKLGKVEIADRGTLYLEQIERLSIPAQSALLQTLETGRFARLGSDQTRLVELRLIASTAADLEEEIAAGRVLEKLAFELGALRLEVPPLRDRIDDLLPLVQSLVPSDRLIERDAIEALERHDWPGNLRELIQRTERALTVGGRALTGSDFGLGQEGADLPLPGDERSILKAALARHHGNVSRAAEELGLSRQALYRRMERCGLGIEKRLKD